MSKPHIRIHSSVNQILQCKKCCFGNTHKDLCGADVLLHRELRCWTGGGYYYELISGDLPNGNM